VNFAELTKPLILLIATMPHDRNIMAKTIKNEITPTSILKIISPLFTNFRIMNNVFFGEKIAKVSPANKRLYFLYGKPDIGPKDQDVITINVMTVAEQKGG
jgi:hypothetical protein